MLWEGSDLPSLVHCAELALGAGAVSELKEGEREHPPPRQALGSRLGARQLSGSREGPTRRLGSAGELWGVCVCAGHPP